MKDDPNLYARLGVPIDATTDEIRRAYRDSARRLHPDTNTDPGETELFLQIQQAYDVISNPEKRAAYNASMPKNAGEPPAVNLRMHFSRSKILRLKEHQLFYALIELFAPEGDEKEAPPPINTCLVVDSSTSMQGAVMDSVKSAAIEIVRSLHVQDMFGLVSFSDNAQVLAPGGIKLDNSKIETAIRMLKPQGGTEIYKGLQAGYDEIKKTRRTGYINHLILMTDGNTYGDEARCLRLARQARDEGITISTLGIGIKWNDDFLDNLATITGGSCNYISKPKDISKFMEERFYSLGKSYASQVAFHADLDSAAQISYAFRLIPDASPLELELPVQIGSIPKGNLLSFMLEFDIGQLDEQVDNLQLADAHISLEIPSRVIPFYNLRFKIEVPVAAEAESSDPPSVEIVQALSKLTLYRMQERVQKELTAGNVQEAASSLKYLATNLLACGEKELANTAIREAAALEQSNGISEEGKKHIKFGTRSLLLSHFGSRVSIKGKKNTEALDGNGENEA